MNRARLPRLRAQLEIVRLARYAADVGEPLDQALTDEDAPTMDADEFKRRQGEQLARLAKLGGA